MTSTKEKKKQERRIGSVYMCVGGFYGWWECGRENFSYSDQRKCNQNRLCYATVTNPDISGLTQQKFSFYS